MYNASQHYDRNPYTGRKIDDHQSNHGMTSIIVVIELSLHLSTNTGIGVRYEITLPTKFLKTPTGRNSMEIHASTLFSSNEIN